MSLIVVSCMCSVSVAIMISGVVRGACGGATLSVSSCVLRFCIQLAMPAFCYLYPLFFDCLAVMCSAYVSFSIRVRLDS